MLPREMFDKILSDRKKAEADGMLTDYQRGFFDGRLAEVTSLMESHPDDWDGACLCDECKSYL